jgi:hypothetical protein
MAALTVDTSHNGGIIEIRTTLKTENSTWQILMPTFRACSCFHRLIVPDECAPLILLLLIADANFLDLNLKGG